MIDMKGAGTIQIGVLAAALLAVTAPAYADIDQLCLKHCVANGEAAATCLGNCSYGAAETPVGTSPLAQNSNQSKNHNVMPTPVPIDPHTVVQPKKAPPPPPEKDYVCLSQCLRNGETYRLCDQRCTKVQCPAGSLDCSDVAHVLNGAVVKGPAGATSGMPSTPLTK